MSSDLNNLCIHTITTKPWELEECVKNFSEQGVRGITIWKELLENHSMANVRSLLNNHDMTPVSLCRSGFFVSKDKRARQNAIEQNIRDIALAHDLCTHMIVLVCGADPSVSLFEARKQITEGIATILPEASAADVTLAIEPLHPMYADCRSAINTMKQANDICDELASPYVGVAADVYHIWWDDSLENEILRCGNNGYLKAFHICDWKTPTEDFLTDRALMGEGCIPISKIRQWTRNAGFNGFDEVEIFSNIHWASDQNEFLKNIISAYKSIH